MDFFGNGGRFGPPFKRINLVRQLEGQVAGEPQVNHLNPNGLMHSLNGHLRVGKKSQLVAAAAIGLRNDAVSFPTLLRVLAKGRTATLANCFGGSHAGTYFSWKDFLRGLLACVTLLNFNVFLGFDGGRGNSEGSKSLVE
jgi:hypothetical protein